MAASELGCRKPSVTFFGIKNIETSCLTLGATIPSVRALLFS